MAKSLDQIPFDFSEVDSRLIQEVPVVPSALQNVSYTREEKKKPVIKSTGIIKDQKPVSTRGRRSLKRIWAGSRSDLHTGRCRSFSKTILLYRRSSRLV